MATDGLVSTDPLLRKARRGAPDVYSVCMARRNISLPDDLDERARTARLNVSALAQRAVADELDRQQRMASLDAWLDELDATHGAPSAKAKAEAEAWLDSASARAVQPKRKAAKARTAPPRAGLVPTVQKAVAMPLAKRAGGKPPSVLEGRPLKSPRGRTMSCQRPYRVRRAAAGKRAGAARAEGSLRSRDSCWGRRP